MTKILGERSFRTHYVLPFLRNKLPHTAWFPIQQSAFVGDADYILCSRGQFVWLELKRVGEKPEPIQQYKADWVKRCGGTALCATAENWEKIKSILSRIDEGESL